MKSVPKPVFLLLASLIVAVFGGQTGFAMPATGELSSVQAETPETNQSADDDSLGRPAPGSRQADRTPPNSLNPERRGLNFLTLLLRGGWFMVPLGVLSILVIALAIERTLALRQIRMLPRGLIRDLSNLARTEHGFQPQQAYTITRSHPSVASRIIRSALLKAGRPPAEIETAAQDAAQREANRLNTVVSWLVLAAHVAPLIGLLGTVWGITQAFYLTTQMDMYENKNVVLAEGIYTALVTTMCGLTIAIPAAVLAHIFEQRIVGWFNRIEELVANLIPQLEPLEGQLQVANAASGAAGSSMKSPQTAANQRPASAHQTTRQRPPLESIEPESASGQPR